MGEWVEDEEAIRKFVESFPPEQREEIRRQMREADVRLTDFLDAMHESRKSPKH